MTHRLAPPHAVGEFLDAMREAGIARADCWFHDLELHDWQKVGEIVAALLASGWSIPHPPRRRPQHR